MKLNKSTRSLKTLILAGLMITGITAFSQTGAQPAPSQTTPQNNQQAATPEISDAKLKKFVDVYKKLAPQQQEAETQMVKAIEEQGLTTDRFNEIAAKQQPNQAAATTGGSAEELTKFNAAAKKITVIQKDVQPKIEKLMSDEGMKPEEFEQIAIAYQTSPVIQQKIQALMKQ
jgi:hypothetical protein